ncbi:MAG: hypothetical protein IH984_08865 [Planctomycetes bacterium]|nr:hypothetical protein [Planctomycetota bacterium]
MLFLRNTKGRNTATNIQQPHLGVIILALAHVLLYAANATATPAPGSASAPENALYAMDADNPELPNTSDVVDAYIKLRRWTDNFSLPPADDSEAQITLQGARGICVTLRRSGRVLGTGVDNTVDNLMLRRAAGRAFGEVLGDRVVANLPKALQADIGSMLILELEVAGQPEPLLGRTLPDLARQLSPGLDGIAIRRANQWGLQFPSQMRAANIQARIELQFLPLAVQLGLPAQTPAELTAMSDVSLYRFSTIHLVQLSPADQPFSTFRGDVIVPLADVTPQGIADFADGIASHLLRSFSTHKSARGIKGDYLPHIDKYNILIASTFDQALTAFALAKYAQAPGVQQILALEALEASKQILRNLAAMKEGYDNPLASPVSAAAVIYAALEPAQIDRDPSVQQLLADATNLVIKSFDPMKGFIDSKPSVVGWSDVKMSPIGQSIVAGALGRLLKHSYLNQQLTDKFVRSALNSAWKSVPDKQQVMMLPWLGWGEDDFATATNGRTNSTVSNLISLRQILHNSIITEESHSGVLDLCGGFALRGQGLNSATAQSLRPAAYLASMLRDPRLTSPDSLEIALNKHLQTMRFAMQLAIRDTSTWFLRNPPRAIGGVRNGISDIVQPIPAQALGLLTASETLKSLKNLPQGQKNNNL